jgi:hypothetical protein
MQQSKTTNVILGIIAIALIIIVIVLVTKKNPEPISSTMNDTSAPVSNVNPTMPNNQAQAPIQQPTTAQPAPTPTQPTYPAIAVSAATTSNPNSSFPAVIQSAQTQSPNFAGHYLIITVRCGNGCQAPYLYDKNTGVLYQFPTAVMANTSEPDATLPTSYSVSGNIFTLEKKNAAGIAYNENWALTASGFVKH